MFRLIEERMRDRQVFVLDRTFGGLGTAAQLLSHVSERLRNEVDQPIGTLEFRCLRAYGSFHRNTMKNGRWAAALLWGLVKMGG